MEIAIAKTRKKMVFRIIGTPNRLDACGPLSLVRYDCRQVIRQQADFSPKGSGYKARGSAIVRERAEWAWLEQLQRRLSDAGRGS
jgi:hypothetical protein